MQNIFPERNYLYKKALFSISIPHYHHSEVHSPWKFIHVVNKHEKILRFEENNIFCHYCRLFFHVVLKSSTERKVKYLRVMRKKLFHMLSKWHFIQKNINMKLSSHKSCKKNALLLRHKILVWLKWNACCDAKKYINQQGEPLCSLHYVSWIYCKCGIDDCISV